MKTAITELFERYGHLLPDIEKEFLEKEKQQVIDVAIKTTQDCWISITEYLGVNLEFSEEDLSDQKKEAEQHYNETFKKD